MPLSRLIRRYTHWLHTAWPAGTVEKMPEVREDGTCNVPGIYIVGDLTGIPLLKFALQSGAETVRRICADPKFKAECESDPGHDAILDLAIVGGGVSGMAAAVEARRCGLKFEVIEASQPFDTIINFPARKPIFTYPTQMKPESPLQVTADVKEALVDELRDQVKRVGIETRKSHVLDIQREQSTLCLRIAEGEPIFARRVVVAIGRSGNYHKLDVPGEELPKVYNRLHDPKDFCEKKSLVVGGGDSALETAIALTRCGGDVTLSYRRGDFMRAKPENVEALLELAHHPEHRDAIEVEQPSSDHEAPAVGEWVAEADQPMPRGRLKLLLPSSVKEIHEDSVTLETAEGDQTLQNDVVFAMIGREPPLDFFRRSGIRISGEGTPVGWIAFAVFLLLCIFVYSWKADGPTRDWIDPSSAPAWLGALGDWWAAQVTDRSTLLGTIAVSMKSRSFYYTLAYSLAVLIFGIARIRRRRTPYVTLQTWVLIAIQVIPLFILPEIILPWLGYNGWFDAGLGATVADNLFEKYISNDNYAAGVWPEWGHPRAYWRAYGLILAWPLMVYNIFTASPMAWWLIIGFLQTFIAIPAMIYFWGKGAYCGWICSCGALAETVGDTQRHKMPHGPFWNRLNMAGQAILAIAFLLLALRITGWAWPGGWADRAFGLALEGTKNFENPLAYLNYKWTIDVFLAGILGVGLYFKYSGRVWCRFFCPLAALMHIYARFSRFRIFADKKKCISCNVCTSVCHQGIDVMNFANKGAPMKDPECVRCSACVQSCPTGVLSFGQADRHGRPIRYDRLAASRIQMNEANESAAGR